MTEYKFNKSGVEEMTHKTYLECLDKLTDGTIDEMYIEIKMGKQFIKIPMDADSLEIITAAIKECEELC